MYSVYSCSLLWRLTDILPDTKNEIIYNRLKNMNFAYIYARKNGKFDRKSQSGNLLQQVLQLLLYPQP